MGHRRSALAGLALVALALAACSSGSSPSRPHDDLPDDICFGCSTSGRYGPDAEGPFVIQGARPGGDVTVLTHDGLAATIDPSEVRAPDVLSIDSGLLTRSLTQYRYDRASKQMMLVPDLATDLGEHNDDYTRWKYTIRHGGRFENGQRITAADIVRGVRRCQHAASFPTGPCRDFLGTSLASVKATQHRSTVEFRFTQPTPDLPYLGTFPELGPVPAHHSLAPATYRLHPLATGPYRIERYVPSRVLVLTRNPEWDARTDPARTAYPDRYVFRSGLPSRSIDERLLSGAASTTLTYDDVLPSDLDRMRDAGQVVLGRTSCLTYWAPDNRTVSDRRVRLALAWAYPYRTMLRIGGLVPRVTAFPTSTIEPPGTQGRKGYRVDEHAPWRTSPRHARHLLTEAHALGRPIRFAFTSGDRTSLREKAALARALRSAGFTPRPEATVSTSLAQPGPPVDVRTSTWCGEIPAASALLPPLLQTTPRNRLHSLGTNLSAFTRPRVDAKIRAIERMPLDKIPEVWTRLDRTVMERWFPLVPIASGGVAMAHGVGIRGMVDDPLRGMPDWKGLWVSS